MGNLATFITPQTLAPYHGEAKRLLSGNEAEAARALVAASRAFEQVRDLAQANADKYRKEAVVYVPSFVDCILDMVRLGLTPGSDEGYLIPFWDKNAGAYAVELIVGPRGLMRLAYESGRVSRILAETVCDGDVFDYDLDQGTFKHRKGRRAFVNHDERHEAITEVYSQAIIIPDGMTDAQSARRLVVLSRGDIEYYRGFSKAPNGDLWGKHFDGAAKKTAIKRLCEQLPRRDGKFGAALRESMTGGFVRPADWDSVTPLPEAPLRGPRLPAAPSSSARAEGQPSAPDAAPAFDLPALLADIQIARETGDASLWPGLHERMLAAPGEAIPSLLRARIEALTRADDQAALDVIAELAKRVPRGPVFTELRTLKETRIAKLREAEAGAREGCA